MKGDDVTFTLRVEPSAKAKQAFTSALRASKGDSIESTIKAFLAELAAAGCEITAIYGAD